MSADSGATWTATDAFNTNYFVSLASSADGTLLFAGLNPGGIYVAHATPAPLLTIQRAGPDLLISWTIPSADFALQQSQDPSGSNWLPVTNTPTANLAKLQYQVLLSPDSTNRFYRLASP
jgi:hypothetical protein